MQVQPEDRVEAERREIYAGQLLLRGVEYMHGMRVLHVVLQLVWASVYSLSGENGLEGSEVSCEPELREEAHCIWTLL